MDERHVGLGVNGDSVEKIFPRRIQKEKEEEPMFFENLLDKKVGKVLKEMVLLLDESKAGELNYQLDLTFSGYDVSVKFEVEEIPST